MSYPINVVRVMFSRLEVGRRLEEVVDHTTASNAEVTTGTLIIFNSN